MRHLPTCTTAYIIALAAASSAWAQAAPSAAVTPVLTPLQTGNTTQAITEAVNAPLDKRAHGPDAAPPPSGKKEQGDKQPPVQEPAQK